MCFPHQLRIHSLYFVLRTECPSFGCFESWLASNGGRQGRSLERHSQSTILHSISGAFFSGRLAQSCWHCSPYNATGGKFSIDWNQYHFCLIDFSLLFSCPSSVHTLFYLILILALTHSICVYSFVAFLSSPTTWSYMISPYGRWLFV